MSQEEENRPHVLRQAVANLKSEIERLTDVLLQARNYAAGESPDVEELPEVKVFGMIVDLIDEVLEPPSPIPAAQEEQS